MIVRAQRAGTLRALTDPIATPVYCNRLLPLHLETESSQKLRKTYTALSKHTSICTRAHRPQSVLAMAAAQLSWEVIFCVVMEERRSTAHSCVHLHLPRAAWPSMLSCTVTPSMCRLSAQSYHEDIVPSGGS